MLRALVLVSALLVTGLAAPASAEEVRVGPCEVDGCVYACVKVKQSCPGETAACVFWAFQLWCV